MLAEKSNISLKFKIMYLAIMLIFLIQILFFNIPNNFFARPINNLLLMFSSYFLIKSYPSPLPKLCSKGNQTKTLLLGFILLVIICYTKSIIGNMFFIIIPIVAGIFSNVFRTYLNRRHLILATIITIFSIITALIGNGSGITQSKWALLQVLFVFPSFLGGWALLNGSGYGYLGVGRSIFITEGTMHAIKAFGYGMILALPWSLGKILMPTSYKLDWVTNWRHLFVAFNLGVSAEAWGRALWVPIFFFILSKFSNTGNVFRASTLIVAYFSTYIYLADSIFNIFVLTPVAVVLFAMPIATLMFNKNLETALGFHFSIQFFRLLAALMLNNGILLS